MKTIKIGISKCLTGERVRYDGQPQRAPFLMDTLARFVEYVPVCPEVDCGMSIPREAMRLVGDVSKPLLMTNKSNRDMTSRMKRWIKPALKTLAQEELCGFILKSKSPSCGLYRVKIYKEENSIPLKKGGGVFATAFAKHFPDIPLEEDGRLHDQMLRECFIDKVCAYARFKELQRKPDLKLKELMDFHASFKYSIMAHSPARVSELGKLLSGGNSKVKEVAALYLTGLMKALTQRATRRKNTNVLDHLSGYFKKELNAIEKEELRRIISGYHAELYPLLAPLVLLRHYAVVYNNEYLLKQHYLNPDPLQLNCRF